MSCILSVSDLLDNGVVAGSETAPSNDCVFLVLIRLHEDHGVEAPIGMWLMDDWCGEGREEEN